MYRVITCLTTQHDYRLVALAGVVCAVGSLISFFICTQVRESRNTGGSDIWLGVTGVSAGGTIWATHYIAMLAYDSGVPTTYGAGLTTLSLVIAFIITTIGFAVSARTTNRWGIMAGGLILGLGVAAMHFIGMNALIVAGVMEWDLPLAVVATLIGSFFTAAAMAVFFRGHGVKAIVYAACLFSLGVCSLHFTAMGAVTITPDPTISVLVSRFDELKVALAIAFVTLIVLAPGIVVIIEQNRASREINEKTRELVDAAQEALVLAKDGCIVDANLRATELCGLPLNRLIGTSVFGGLLDAAAPVNAGGVFTLETNLKGEDGAVPVEVVRQPLKASGYANEFYAIRDLRELIKTTDRLKQMNQELQDREKELRLQNFRFKTAVSNMSQGLCMFDGHQRVVISNDRYAELYGLSPEEIAPGTTLTEIIDRRIAKGMFAGSSAEKYRRERLAPLVRDLDMTQELCDGRFVSITLRLMAGGGWVTTHEDVTEQRRAEARISHMAHHDALTDLPNRVLLSKKLEKHLQGSRPCDTCIAVLMLDLDRFKEVNDTLGHHAGDVLLQTVAERLRSGLRQSATVARFGGDEFAIIETISSTDDVEALPRRVTELISLPMEIEGQTVSVGTSIGIAVSPLHGVNSGDLLKRADLALYRAKGEAKGTYRFFEPGMDAAAQDRRNLENDLRQGLVRGEFELHYQPLLNLERNEVTVYEALIRWKHPTRGMIMPSVFIPLAEETGFIGPLGEWVLQQACAEAATWPADLKIAVNLSVQQFKSRDLLRAVIAALASSQLPPQRLELEITETVMLKDAEDVFATLRQLQDLGVRLALDDFGTGFSALNYLLRFTFHKIKIDRSFVNGLPHNPHSLVLLRSLIQIGRGLGVDVTAEGVETPEQFEIVRAEGCTEIQGFYLGQPKPASELNLRRLRHLPSSIEAETQVTRASVSAAG